MRVIILTRGQHTVVSDHVYEWANKLSWFAQIGKQTFYAARSAVGTDGKQKCILLHREILKARPGELVDHRDFDGLNNLDDNIRICDLGQNMQNTRRRRDNTSGYKGVSLSKRSKRWTAYIFFDGKRTHLGYFDTALEAAHVYDEAALRNFGEFAHLNFPLTVETTNNQHQYV